MHDVSDLVRPALAICPRIDEVVGGYTDGKVFFFADEQVADIAKAAGPRLLHRSGRGWRQRLPIPQTLTRHLIHGQLHYQFPEDWHWRQIDPQPGRRVGPQPVNRAEQRSVHSQ